MGNDAPLSARYEEPHSEDGSERVDLAVRYPEGEPELGVLAYDLLEIDRGFREAVRRARSEEEPKGRAGWPGLRESPRVVRASTRSPLDIEATKVVTHIVELAIGGGLSILIAKAVSRRLANRAPRDRPVEVHVHVYGENNVIQGAVVKDGQAKEVDEILEESPDHEPQ
jgi:hypothetical protein